MAAAAKAKAALAASGCKVRGEGGRLQPPTHIRPPPEHCLAAPPTPLNPRLPPQIPSGYSLKTIDEDEDMDEDMIALPEDEASGRFLDMIGLPADGSSEEDYYTW